MENVAQLAINRCLVRINRKIINMKTEKNPKGAGRKPTGRIGKSVHIMMSEENIIKFKSIGGNAWLRQYLEGLK